MVKHDTSQGILVIVRRGRGGRGFTLAPVDSPTDVAICVDANDIGNAIIEMIDDEKQPRVDIDALIQASQGDFEEREEKEEVHSEKKKPSSNSKEEKEEEDEEEDGEEEDEEEDEPWYKAKDPADAFLIAGLTKLIEKGQQFGYKNRKTKRRRRKKKV